MSTEHGVRMEPDLWYVQNIYFMDFPLVNGAIATRGYSFKIPRYRQQ